MNRVTHETIAITTQPLHPSILILPRDTPPPQICQADTHISPSTLANEVRMSERITSQKNGGIDGGGTKMRRNELEIDATASAIRRTIQQGDQVDGID
jgi:hypothetical protein